MSTSEGAYHRIKNAYGRFLLLNKVRGIDDPEVTRLQQARELYRQCLETADENASGVSNRLTDESDPDGEMIPYNFTAILKESTLDKYLEDYAAESSPKYAQAYITYMRPGDFLGLTTESVSDELIIKSQSHKLDEGEFSKATVHQPIQLIINSDGKVTGHEGRHRMVALEREGITRVPVLLFNYQNKNGKTAVGSMDLSGQDFSGHNYSTATVENVIPLSYENRNELVKKFATKSFSQKMQEQYGQGKTLQYRFVDNGNNLTEADNTSVANTTEEAYNAYRWLDLNGITSFKQAEAIASFEKYNDAKKSNGRKKTYDGPVIGVVAAIEEGDNDIIFVANRDIHDRDAAPLVERVYLVSPSSNTGKIREAIENVERRSIRENVGRYEQYVEEYCVGRYDKSDFGTLDKYVEAERKLRSAESFAEADGDYAGRRPGAEDSGVFERDGGRDTEGLNDYRYTDETTLPNDRVLKDMLRQWVAEQDGAGNTTPTINAMAAGSTTPTQNSRAKRGRKATNIKSGDTIIREWSKA